MADEPAESSINYNPGVDYMAPLGRLPILGKARAEIDRIRAAMANDLNTIKNRDLAQIDSNAKITGELAVLQSKSASDISTQESKTAAEVSLLDQKAVTELAQTCDTIPVNSGMNNTTAVEGVVLKQKGLFQKQTDGFDRDAEQKLAKIMVDSWSVRQSTEGGVTSLDAGLANAEIDKVMTKVKSGIGVI